MSISYETWRSNVEMIVQAFADKSFQENAWSGKASTSFNSPDEMMAVYFDDVIVPDFIDEYADILGSACVDSGANLTVLLENYSWPMTGGFIDADILIGQPEWGNIIGAAAGFLDELKKTYGSRSAE